MFDDYKKHLDNLGANSSKVFKYVANKGAKHFVNEAIEHTDREKLVDTGAYRRNWWAENIQRDDVHAIKVGNDMEYASHLEYGHKLRNGKQWKGRFVGRMALDGTEGYTLIELNHEIDLLMKQKEYKITRAEAKKYFS